MDQLKNIKKSVVIIATNVALRELRCGSTDTSSSGVKDRSAL